ncbi:MAG: GNAT family N-acetyltransferase [Clostridia bacterium]|nr:GNAT family N-acetyltransferase [Clostridia bacterium]
MNAASSEIKIRRSVSGDEPELKRLWQTVFGDTEEFIDTFFNILYSTGAACLALSGGKVVSAGYCLTGVVAKGKKCSYIYAVATYPEFRGLGTAARIARSLAELSFADGTDVIATLPASESLTGWYELVLGMEPIFKKGLPGAEFPDSWHRFAEITGTEAGGAASSSSPDRLWAVGAPGVNLEDLRGVGWALTFE